MLHTNQKAPLSKGSGFFIPKKAIQQMPIIITGHKRHGKDTLAEYLRDRKGMTFESSSMFAAKTFLFDALKDKYGYTTTDECFADRVNHREEWFDAIVKYNTPDLTRLGRAIFAKNDIYCGLRNIDELNALRKAIPDLSVIWVDRLSCLPPESEGSMTITKQDADFIIDNNESLAWMYEQADYILSLLRTGAIHHANH